MQPHYIAINFIFNFSAFSTILRLFCHWQTMKLIDKWRHTEIFLHMTLKIWINHIGCGPPCHWTLINIGIHIFRVTSDFRFDAIFRRLWILTDRQIGEERRQTYNIDEIKIHNYDIANDAEQVFNFVNLLFLFCVSLLIVAKMAGSTLIFDLLSTLTFLANSACMRSRSSGDVRPWKRGSRNVAIFKNQLDVILVNRKQKQTNN